MFSRSLRVVLSCLMVAVLSQNGFTACWYECGDCQCECPCEVSPCPAWCVEWVPCDELACDCSAAMSCATCELESPAGAAAPVPAKTHKPVEDAVPRETPTFGQDTAPPAVGMPQAESEQPSAAGEPTPGVSPAPGPSATEPAEILPPAPAPEESPVESASEPTTTEQPSIDTDGLFVEPAPEPAEEPLTESGSAPPAESPAPMEEAPEQPAAESGESPSFEEMFGEPAPPADATEEEQPAEEQPQDEKEEPAADPFDPFSRLETPARQGMASFVRTDSRLWTARSSHSTLEGSLVGATGHAVVVQQEDGTFWAVAFGNLSRTDLEYVRDQIRWQRALQAPPEAGTQLAVGWSH